MVVGCDVRRCDVMRFCYVAVDVGSSEVMYCDSTSP